MGREVVAVLLPSLLSLLMMSLLLPLLPSSVWGELQPSPSWEQGSASEVQDVWVAAVAEGRHLGSTRLSVGRRRGENGPTEEEILVQ